MTAVLYAVRTQQVVTDALVPTLAVEAAAVFMAVDVTHAAGDPVAGAPPRDTWPHVVLTWNDSLLAPAAAWGAGDRLDVDDYGLVELLDDPAASRLHAGVIRWEARAMLLSALRPLGATVLDQAGVPLADGAVTIAAWRPSRADRARGVTVDYQGEAGVEHAVLLTPENRRLALSAGVLRVTAATVEASPPRVALELRAPDG